MESLTLEYQNLRNTNNKTLVNYVDLTWNNVCIVDLNKIIQNISITVINDLNNFQIDCNFKKILCKRFIYSYLILNMCEELSKIKTSSKIVFYYNTESISFGWFTDFFLLDDCKEFFIKTVKLLGKNLPLKIFTGKVSIEYITNELQSNNQDIILLTNSISLFAYKNSVKNSSFAKARQFLDKHNLNYLSKKYFTTIKSMQCMYK